uniref:BRCT domain-containing protein n=1 Tax=Anopheles culicifacies TaxID=139723 RepID=A0A182MT05_9DIPT
MAYPALSVLGTSVRRTSLVETIATVHKSPYASSDERTSFLVPETQQLDSSIASAKHNETRVSKNDHLLEEENDDDELCFIPETQQPEDELNSPSDVIAPILPDVPETEQPATEEEYFQMTVENEDNSNDAMFNNKYIEQSQNLMQNLDVSYNGVVVPRVSIQPDRYVDSISFQEHRNTTMEMSRIEWNESKKASNEQSMIATPLLQQSKKGEEALNKDDNAAEDADDRSITPELNFDDDRLVERDEKQASLAQEINFKDGPNKVNRATENNYSSVQGDRSSKTPELYFDDQENENNEHEISLNQEGCDKRSGKIVDIPELATILVTDRIIRTYKFLCSVAKGIPIVGQSYLDALQHSDANEHIDAWDHILSDPVKEKRYDFCLRDTLLKAKQHKLFQDYTVFVTSSTQPPPSELYYRATWVKYKEKFPNIEIISAEGFMLSIMQHSIKFKKYRLI